LESIVKLADDLIPSMLSGAKKVTIRKGTREYAPEIEIAGYPAVVDSVEHYPLGAVPFEILLSDGFVSFTDTLERLARFYPDITFETMVTVLRFHLKGEHAEG
jgi:hypothetical protein